MTNRSAPKDANQRAKSVLDAVIDRTEHDESDDGETKPVSPAEAPHSA